MPERFYNLQQVAERLQTNRMTLRKWLHDAGMETSINPRNKKEHLLSQAQLEHLAHLKRITLPTDAPAKSTDTLAALEARLKRYIDQRLAALRAELMDKLDTPEPRTIEHAAVRVPTPSPAQPNQSPTPTPSPVASATTAPNSDTSVYASPKPISLAKAFVELHGIEWGRARQSIVLIGNDLDAAGRALFYQRWYDKAGFVSCRECPHVPED